MPVSKKSHPDWVQLAIRLLQWGICILLLVEQLCEVVYDALP